MKKRIKKAMELFIMDLEEKTIRSDPLFKGKIINLKVDEVLLPDGSKSKREIVEHPGAVAIVPINDKKEVICVCQFRKAVEKILLEIPAGKLEEGETGAVCAQRELIEETGYRAKKLIKMTSFYSSPGFSSEKIDIYLGLDLEKETIKKPADEFIIIKVFPLKDLLKKIRKGMVEDGKTIIGLMLASDYLD